MARKLSQSQVFDAVRTAALKRKSERAQLTAIAKMLAIHGGLKQPKVRSTRDSAGGTVRLYVYEGTSAGDFVLITGPSIEAEVKPMSDLAVEKAPKGFYVEVGAGSARDEQRVKRALTSAEKAAKRAARAGAGGKTGSEAKASTLRSMARGYKEPKAPTSTAPAKAPTPPPETVEFDFYGQRLKAYIRPSGDVTFQVRDRGSWRPFGQGKWDGRHLSEQTIAATDQALARVEAALLGKVVEKAPHPPKSRASKASPSATAKRSKANIVTITFNWSEGFTAPSETMPFTVRSWKEASKVMQCAAALRLADVKARFPRESPGSVGGYDKVNVTFKWGNNKEWQARLDVTAADALPGGRFAPGSNLGEVMKERLEGMVQEGARRAREDGESPQHPNQQLAAGAREILDACTFTGGVDTRDSQAAMKRYCQVAEETIRGLKGAKGGMEHRVSAPSTSGRKRAGRRDTVVSFPEYAPVRAPSATGGSAFTAAELAAIQQAIQAALQ